MPRFKGVGALIIDDYRVKGRLSFGILIIQQADERNHIN